jgi:hypothetical protein
VSEQVANLLAQAMSPYALLMQGTGPVGEGTAMWCEPRELYTALPAPSACAAAPRANSTPGRCAACAS